MAEQCAYNINVHVNPAAAPLSTLVILSFIALCFLILFIHI